MSKPDFPSLCAMHRAACAKLGPLPALRFKVDGMWRHISWNDYRRQADEVAAGLMELGVKPGDRIALLSENRWEWLVADHAILSTGAFDVPIHAPSTPAQIQFQLEHSGACGVVLSSVAQLEKVLSVKSQLPDLRFAVIFDRCAATPSDQLTTYTFDAIRQSGVRAGDAGRKEIAAREAAITADDVATVIYTSGTTNRPKGVMLSQGNLVTNSKAGAEAYGFDCTRVWLNWLPFSHVFARLVDDYSTTRMGVTMALATSSATVMDDIREIQPTYFTSVPRLLEKAWAHLVSFPESARVGEARKMFGHRLIHISSGGAPLPSHVATDLREAGVIVLEGYGLTESSPIISFNLKDSWKIGTVGRPISGVEIKIADDGEVLTRGPHVMLGYWHDPKATAEAIQDGWLYTGDLGAIDSEGFLSITGRKKDLIVTSGGKNIAPSALEALMISDPFIEQALVFGDARPYVCAIIVPKFEKIDEAVKESGGVFTNEGDVVIDAKLIAWFQKRVDTVLKVVSQVERVKKIIVLNRPLSIDADELTVTQKIRRTAVFRRYQKNLEALYQGSSE
ncbi:AMP-dependent synthetase/ligase [Schlesneria paludicola]|uniref:AMP-dependent synthetase/ligase n=1 Tax=Schlesneria paludicola TaxID=360056 RepID=UPI00029A5C96|nr:AMP-dependent synthetase/ligase [Schlesneria paludicola]